MKLARIQRNGVASLVSAHPNGQEGHCLNLQQACEIFRGAPVPAFTTMRAFIDGGEAAIDLASELAEQATHVGAEACHEPIESVEWLVPVEAPRNFLCAGRNFHGHHRESSLGWKKTGVDIAALEFPIGFVKLPNTLRPANAPIEVPVSVTELDYEVEVAAVLGRPTQDVPSTTALDHVFGYTVFIDLSARDWQRREMKQQMLLIGKNFPGFGPLGPWIVTRDELPDPSVLDLRLNVNGQERQHGSAHEMIFSFPELISFWSRIGLEAGDLIASGTPEGVAMHMSDPQSAYLKSGDEVVASVEPLGTLRVRIR